MDQSQLKSKIIGTITSAFQNGYTVRTEENDKGTSYSLKLRGCKTNFAKATDTMARDENINLEFENPQDGKRYFVTNANALEAREIQVADRSTGEMKPVQAPACTYINLQLAKTDYVNDDEFAMDNV